jgi:hypothetical protein
MLKTLLAAVLTCTAGLAGAQPFTLVVLGDMPYGPPEAVYPPFEALIETVNGQSPDIVIHVGDTKSGSIPCTDEILAEQLAYLDSFAAPTLYTPGDNEWTDCHRPSAGGFAPRERLAHIRDTYFAAPGRSFGRKRITLESQAPEGYPENVRLMKNEVMIATAHVVGSNNNFEPRTPSAVEEFFARDAANRAWLSATFAAARKAEARAMVLAIHADMFEFAFGPPWDPEAFLRHSGFKRFGEALIAEANAFGRPVLLTYGDSHVFRMFRPFAQKAPGIMALEVFGARNMHAVTVRVRPADTYPFAVQPIPNPAAPLIPAQQGQTSARQ